MNPTLWIVRDDAGMWGGANSQAEAQVLAEEWTKDGYPSQVFELFERAALDAAVAAERERWLKAAEQNVTEVRGIFAYPDDHAEVKEAAAKIARRRQRAEKRAKG